MEEQSTKISYEYLWKSIIRPPRDYYLEEDLGPTNFKFNGKTYIRKDFDLVDFKGLILKLSIIEPDTISRPFDIMPIVIYVHANSSSRAEGVRIKNNLLKKNINICSFDFEGSGYSEGEYISLGYHEKKQLKNVVDFIENYPGVGEIGLWGRSMGASTSLIYASMDKRIKAIVVDSPFTDFRRIAKEICMAQVSVPGFVIGIALSIIGKSIYSKNKMDINDIKPIEAVKKCDIPVMFVHAKDDDMVNFQHTLDLYNNYRGIHKEIKETHGGHNGKRSSYLMELISKFFFKHLKDDNFKSEDEVFSKDLNSDFVNEININKNLEETLPKKKNKTIYEEWGIPNPISKKEVHNDKPEEIYNKKIDEINIIPDNSEKKEIKEEGKKDGKIEEKKEEKKEIVIEEIKKDQKEIKIEEIKKDKREINIESKQEEKKGENNEEKKEQINTNEINLRKNSKEEFKFEQNLTFYNTNKNFGSYIDAIFNNKNEISNKNNENEIKNEEQINNDNQSSKNNENNIININITNPNRKTIYDDLNLRPKFK